MDATHAPDLLTVPECATRLRLHRVSVYRAIASGKLRAIRLGDERGPLRVREADLDAYCVPTTERPRSAALGAGLSRARGASVRAS